MTDRKPRGSLARGLATALVFLALAGAAFILHFTRMEAPPYHALRESGEAAPRDAVFAALSPEAVSRAYSEIAAFGSRAPGQPGLGKARDYILGRFRDLGLETYTQDVDVPYPLLAECSGLVSNASFRTQAWPLRPNYAQPVTTGPGGVEGELFLADSSSMRSCGDFSGKIAVIDLGGDVFHDFGLMPSHYIALGFRAVVYTHRDGLEAADWEWASTVAALRFLPVNIVRVACPPEILAHCGERVVIDAVSTWRNARAQNVVGVLRAPESEGRALFVAVQYDAASALPDIAHGSLEAFQAAMLVQTAEALSGIRDHLRRDVVFAATVGASQEHLGANRLLSALGYINHRADPAASVAAAIAENDGRAAMIDSILAVLDGAADAEALSARIRQLPRAAQKFLAERFSVAMRELVFGQSERLLQAKIAYERRPGDLESREYRDFRREKAVYDRLNSLSGMPIAKAMVDAARAGRDRAVESERGIGPGLPVETLRASLLRLRRFHEDRGATLEADARLAALFAGFTDVCAVTPRFMPAAQGAGEKIGVSCGRGIAIGETFSVFKTLTSKSLHRLGFAGSVPVAEDGWNGFSNFYTCELDCLPFCVAGYPAFSLVSAAPPRRRSLWPFEQPEFADAGQSAARSLKVFGDVAAELAGSAASFPRLPGRSPFGVGGSVFASGVGNSVVPNYPVENAFLCSRDRKQPLFTDPYGGYDEPFILVPDGLWERSERFDAFLFDRWGRIVWAKDFGTAAQSVYASNFIPFYYKPQNHILYRGAPVAVFDTVNPQSLKAFSGFAFISNKGLASFNSACPFSTAEGFMDFLPPDGRFFLTLKAGAPGNDLVAVTREFCLGTAATNSPAWKPSGAEIEGPGYLAADTPVLCGVVTEAIASMSWLTDKRLSLQRRYGIADELTEAFAEKAAGMADAGPGGTGDGGVDAAAAPGAGALSRLRRNREALSYLILNHPVVRGTISEAVFCIIWYLGLLVPFAFFFEKLLFAFTDARKQVLAQGAVFLLTFLLLRVLHPAFHMIRSSAMILLGFLIIIIVCAVMALLSGKFQENINALRRSQGHVVGAEGNKSGIILTAFMLGLNNMHRRRVRTGLTCATLVLMTFVMVCFTSVQSNIVDSERAVGSAAYQGIVVRDREFRPVSGAEVDALKSEFGERHSVSRRTIFTGWHDSARQSLRAVEFKVAVGEGENSRFRTAHGAIGFDATEPLAKSIRLLCTNGWFTAEAQAARGASRPVMVSGEMAGQLGITQRAVEDGEAVVTVNGTPFTVWNIFDSASLAAATDPDGHDLLPFDVETMTTTRFAGGELVIADDATPRVAAENVILVLNDTLRSDWHGVRAVSAAIDMGGSPYSVARAEIVSFMERSGRECHYALDGTAFVGQRARSRSSSGYLELLIPLVIAALTVLNTMKGSVYERQNEIYVYNAVGIAPRYIFFIFIAESLVYAVVGSVLGYILSLGAGRLVTLFGATGGAGMNFTSATCVYASLAVAGATLLSTWFPARTAMQIAKPTDDAGWSLPKPDAEGRLSFLLPFTFTRSDRIAVLAFFQRYFEGFGEGGAGPFFAAEPAIKIAGRLDDLAGGAYIPAIEVKVWLKPFDLGVSQLLEIELATDPETREFIARLTLTRLTGTLDAWRRLNGPFVTAIRRRFLHWRAVTPEMKAELYAAAKAEFMKLRP